MLVTNIDNIKKAIKEVKRKPKKWIEGNFIRGPIDLMELQRFMQRGTRLTKLYLQIIYKQGLQENGQGLKNKKWWPNENDSSWVRLNNDPQFWKYRQDKDWAIHIAIKFGLIEVQGKSPEEKKSPVVRILKPRDKDHDRKFGGLNGKTET